MTCLVGVDAMTGAVAMGWRGYGSSAEFRAANERVLAAIAQGGEGRLIGQIEALGPIPPADQAWLSTDWIPRAVAAGLRQVALVTPAFEVEHAGVLLVGEAVAGALDLGYFDDLEGARAWLNGRGS